MFHTPVQSAMQVNNNKNKLSNRECWVEGLEMTDSFLLFLSDSPQGDRVGICVTQFDPKQVERCLVATPGYLPTLLGEWAWGCVFMRLLSQQLTLGGIVRVHKVSYHKFPCTTGAKFHCIYRAHLHAVSVNEASLLQWPLAMRRSWGRWRSLEESCRRASSLTLTESTPSWKN